MKKLIGILCFIAVCIFLISVICNGNNSDNQNHFHTGSYTDYYYLTLDETEKEAYTAVRESICDFPQKIETPTLSDEQLGNVLSALLYDNPMMFMFDSCTLTSSGNKAYFVPKYKMTEDEYYEYNRLINIEIEKIAKNAPVDEYELELYCHDYIVNNCKYTDTDAYYEDNAVGVFLERKAQCSGYAEAFKILMDRFGIECVLISGTATNYLQETDSHMWTAVKINGSWCYTDPTWDDPITDSDEESCQYVYFNMTEEMLRRSHRDFEFTEECNSPSLYYYIKYKAYFDTCNEDTHSQISALISSAADIGNTSVTLMFASEQAKSKAIDCLFNQEKIYRILETASLASKKPLVTNKVRYLVLEGNNIITIYFEAKE